MFFYPPVATLGKQLNLLGVTAAAYRPDELLLPLHFPHDAHRGTTRFVQFLLDKHATKVAFFPRTAPGEVDFLQFSTSKSTKAAKRGDPKRPF